MENCRVYEDSCISDVLLNSAPQVLNSIWCPDPSPSFLGSVPMVKFEEPEDQTTKDTPFVKVENCSEEFDHQPEKKRRLRSDQVQFLEKSFEVDNKLEPERKTRLAKQVGLQPRQVAIWFQNRRARYKTKVLEKDYDSLKSEYDRLKVDFDQLFEDNENLKNEVQLLRQNLLPRQNTKPGSPPGRVFDSDSPSSALLEPADSSDVSQNEDDSFVKKSFFPEDDSFVKKACFPKLEDEFYDDLQPNSGNFGFPVQDQGTWLWQY